jgi:predicted nucleotide-binding protein
MTKIFLVHGRDHEARAGVARLLMRGCPDAEVVVLDERPGAARTLIEKYERAADGSDIAVVLMTADDVGGLAPGSDLRPRARQNVVFELGFFVAKLERDRIVVLCEAAVDHDLPTDIKGMQWLMYDEDGAWREGLLRELAGMGVGVDDGGLM